MKSVSKSVAILLIMLIGIVAGILLIDQTQEFREKAKQEEKIKYKVCHKTGSTETPWMQIEVDENALKVHVDHGDITGDCPQPEEPSEEPGGEEPLTTPEPTTANGGQGGQGASGGEGTQGEPDGVPTNPPLGEPGSPERP